MSERSFRGALEESKKLAREAASRAREAMGSVVHHAAVRIRFAEDHAPDVVPRPRVLTVDGHVYEIHEAHDEERRADEFTLHRLVAQGETVFVGSFSVTALTVTIHCAQGAATRAEAVRVVGAALAQQENPTSEPRATLRS
jgi:hypothetical protein